jgi:hypothetical protein
MVPNAGKTRYPNARRKVVSSRKWPGSVEGGVDSERNEHPWHCPLQAEGFSLGPARNDTVYDSYDQTPPNSVTSLKSSSNPPGNERESRTDTVFQRKFSIFSL